MSFAKIRPRRGTASDWSKINPILVEGEIGIEVPDTGVGSGTVKIKFGDGTTPWNELPYGIDLDNVDIGNIREQIEDLESGKFDYINELKTLEDWQAWIVANKRGSFCAPATVSSTNNTQIFIVVTRYNDVDKGWCSMLVFNYKQTLYQCNLRNGVWSDPVTFANTSITDALSTRLTTVENGKFEFINTVKTYEEWQEYIVTNKKGNFCCVSSNNPYANNRTFLYVGEFAGTADAPYTSVIGHSYSGTGVLFLMVLRNGVWSTVNFADSTRVASLEESVANMGTWKDLTLGNGWTGALYGKVDALNKQVFIQGYVYASSSVSNFSFCQINSSANGLPLPLSPYVSFPLTTCGEVCVGTNGATSTVYLYDNKHLTVRSTTTDMYWYINLSYRYS